MGLTPGQRIGPYEVVSAIGAGGMGDVYRARDTKLSRDVALKILLDAVSTDPDRLARLRREAQVLASLNHPNIAHVYGLEDSPPHTAVVMELVEGPTLGDLLAGGEPLPLDETLAIARQIADALEGAHEAGVVHRDLKPSNIKVRGDGVVKVLDFGLAKAIGGERGGADPALSPAMATITSPALTAMGVILGTAAYMAPEQAKGRAVDKRADIWSFGCVLWEMLTGRALFARDGMAETISAVIRERPPFEALPRSTPAAVRQLIERCLERDPRLRLRDSGEARILLTAPERPALPATGRAPWRVVVAASLAALALAAVTGAIVWRLVPRRDVPVRQLELPPSIASAPFWALSPDGTRVVYTAGGHLFVRPLAALDVQDLGAAPGGIRKLFWSPDSRTIGIASSGGILTVEAGGGPIFTVCKIPASGLVMDVQWIGTDIVFAVWRDNIYRVPAAGGTPGVFVAIDPATEVDFHALTAVPGGRMIVTVHGKANDSSALDLFDGAKRVRLSSDTRSDAIAYAREGYLLFLRTTTNPGLWAMRFDGRTLDASAATLIEPRAAAFSLANDGTLLFGLPAVQLASLVWVDRARATAPIAGAPIEDLNSLALSPDARHVAYITGIKRAGNVVVRDLTTGADTALTFNRADSGPGLIPLRPSWFPSGDRILYATGTVAANQLVEQRTDTAAEPRRLTEGINGTISPDGRTLTLAVDDRGTQRLRRAPIAADGTVGTTVPVFRGHDDPNVLDFDVSPDGRLLAYATPIDGRAAIFLTALPDAAGRWQVSTGGRRPRFSHDGRELFYFEGHRGDDGRPVGNVMSVRLTVGPPVTLGPPVRLFDDAQPSPLIIDDLATTADGQRFLMALKVPPGPGQEERLALLQNWPALLKR